MAMTAALGYDFVKIPEGEGTTRTVTRSEYEKIPLAHRVGMVLKNQVEFYRAGVKIPPFEALKIS
jgi:hypothetical protein